MSNSRCPLCKEKLCSKLSHIIPNMYYSATQSRDKEFLFKLYTQHKFDTFLGRRSPLNTEDNPHHYTNEELDKHPHLLGEEYLVCCDCELKFNEKIESISQEALDKVRECYEKEYNIEIAKPFYSLILSIIYRVSISNTLFDYFSFPKKEEYALKNIINSLFEDEELKITNTSLSFNIYQYKGEIDDKQVKSYEKLKDIKDGFSSYFIVVEDDKIYRFLLSDFIVDVSFFYEHLLSDNFSEKKLIVRVLNKDIWNKEVKSIMDNFYKARTLSIKEVIKKYTKDKAIYDKTIEFLCKENLLFHSMDEIESNVKKLIKSQLS